MMKSTACNLPGGLISGGHRSARALGRADSALVASEITDTPKAEPGKKLFIGHSSATAQLAKTKGPSLSAWPFCF